MREVVLRRSPFALPRGVCSVCGRERALRPNRTLRGHRPPVGRPDFHATAGFLDYCRGSGQPPAGDRVFLPRPD